MAEEENKPEENEEDEGQEAAEESSTEEVTSEEASAVTDANDQEESSEEEGEEAPKHKVTHVTNLQWAAMMFLLLGCAFYFTIWPKMASETQVLKEPQTYIDQAMKRFREAHSTHQFPKNTRMAAYQDVIWNYKASEKAGHQLTADDFFRWGLAEFNFAKFMHPNSRYALIDPIQHLEKALALCNPDSEVSEYKIRYLLGRCYLSSENIRDKISKSLQQNVGHDVSASKAIEQFKELRDVKSQFDHYLRRLNRSGELVNEEPPIVLDANPYSLQLSELNRTELLLGQAYFQKNEFLKASSVLSNYLETTRRDALNRSLSSRKIEPDLEARFEALGLLGNIHWKSARQLFIKIKQAKAQKHQGSSIQALQQKWKSHLNRASMRFNNMFEPVYKVYGLLDEKLKMAEVSYHLGNHDTVLEMARGYYNDNRSKLKEMELWRIMSLLAKNKKEPVAPYLTTIAEEPIERYVRLAAWIVLGNSQQALGNIDHALGRLVLSKEDLNKIKHNGSYLQATLNFSEKEFDENPMVDKLSLIYGVIAQASEARNKGDEKKAVKLYKFLLSHFTVPRAEILHHIAFLQRNLARKNVDDKGNTNAYGKTMYKESAQNFLRVLDNDIPHDKRAKDRAYFEAAESFYEGKFYTDAYRAYNNFIKNNEKNVLASKARHKMGVAALHRRRPSRFGDAKAAFIKNITRNVRPIDSNIELPRNNDLRIKDKEFEAIKRQAATEKFKEKLEEFEIKKVLADVNSASRDIWSYHSFLELGNVYYVQHKYDLAKQVFQSIMTDKRFTPKSQIWRKAAYQMARLNFDAVSESDKRVKAWPEAIARLEETLLRYDLENFAEMFFVSTTPDLKVENSDLYREIKSENSDIKYLLAKAYFFSNNPKNNLGIKNSIQHAKDLLNDPDRYNVDKRRRQKVQALLADGLYTLKDYKNALEYYRRAHDWNQDDLPAFERPFYSLNMADCLVSMKEKDKAINLLKRTKWEFEKLYQDDNTITGGQPNLKKGNWVKYIDDKIAALN